MGVPDRLLLRGLRFFGKHGVLKAEKELGQRFEVDVLVSADLSKAGKTDSISDTVNYVKIFDIVKTSVEGPPKNLVEAVAEEIAEKVLNKLPKAQDVRVKVVKPHVALPGVCDAIGVEIFRSRPK